MWDDSGDDAAEVDCGRRVPQMKGSLRTGEPRPLLGVGANVGWMSRTAGPVRSSVDGNKCSRGGLETS